MNLQSKRFPVKTGLLTDVLGRVMTRNIKNKAERTAMRLGFMKNVIDLSAHPERHLAMTMRIIEMRQEQGLPPAFETGLMFGACLALCAGDTAGIGVVRQMLTDLGREQDSLDGVEETPTLEEESLPSDTPKTANENEAVTHALPSDAAETVGEGTDVAP